MHLVFVTVPATNVELAEICLFEADLALDREGAERLRIIARRYLEAAELLLKEKSERRIVYTAAPNNARSERDRRAVPHPSLTDRALSPALLTTQGWGL
jgi:hypothetical protein